MRCARCSRARRPSIPTFDLSLRTIVGRDPIAVDPDEPVARSLLAAFEAELGDRPVVRGEIGWMDSGILFESGVPVRDLRADGRGRAHRGTEWVDVGSVEDVRAGARRDGAVASARDQS